jgi:ubiquinone/menaquinone biosynthesis C-methylase UbiE
LEFADSSFNIVLELGPLYHLVESRDRIAALREAMRIVKKGGLVFAAAISRFATALDGFCRDTVKESVQIEAMNSDLKTGQHRNPTGDHRYFVTSYLHHPDEMKNEMEEAGLAFVSVLAVEGFGWLMPEFDSRWQREEYKSILLETLTAMEEDPSLTGVSAHLLAVGYKVC